MVNAELTIFYTTSIFDLKYCCSILTYKNVQYLIWKIWFISIWSLKSKAVVWLLIGFIKVFKQQVEWNTSVWYIFNIPFGFQRLREFWQVTNWFDFALFEFLIHMKIENNGLFWFWSNPSEHLRKSRNPWNPRNSIWNRICTLK